MCWYLSKNIFSCSTVSSALNSSHTKKKQQVVQGKDIIGFMHIFSKNVIVRKVFLSQHFLCCCSLFSLPAQELNFPLFWAFTWSMYKKKYLKVGVTLVGSLFLIWHLHDSFLFSSFCRYQKKNIELSEENQLGLAKHLTLPLWIFMWITNRICLGCDCVSFVFGFCDYSSKWVVVKNRYRKYTF